MDGTKAFLLCIIKHAFSREQSFCYFLRETRMSSTILEYESKLLTWASNAPKKRKRRKEVSRNISSAIESAHPCTFRTLRTWVCSIAKKGKVHKGNNVYVFKLPRPLLLLLPATVFWCSFQSYILVHLLVESHAPKPLSLQHYEPLKANKPTLS